MPSKNILNLRIFSILIHYIYVKYKTSFLYKLEMRFCDFYIYIIIYGDSLLRLLSSFNSSYKF